MSLTDNTAVRFAKDLFKDFSDDDCPRMAAALSYYTIFSLPAVLVIVATIVGAVFGQAAAEGQIQQQFGSLLGEEGASFIQTMIQNEGERATGSSGIIATILGIGVLLFGAIGAFVELQSALNTTWEVEPDPEKGGINAFIVKRLLSFGMILGIGFLLLVSLVLSAAISAFGQLISNYLPDFFSQGLLFAINIAISLLVITLLFAAIFKIMPDAVVQWKDVGVGALATAVLFVIGKFAIGLYLGHSSVGSAYGAAGTLALLLIWIYYSALIVFIGAEFTQIWARYTGSRIVPDENAVRVVSETRHVDDDGLATDETTEPVRPPVSRTKGAGRR
ncbi:MAG TPA: YihY/virulence factor BrkB family protein [Rhodothermales bacterium]|nr:YihY/virulence factor BrkB family protein [Rhodothermales bacterium]